MHTQVKLRCPKKEDVDKLLELDEIACLATTGRLLDNRTQRRKYILSEIKEESHLIRVAEIKGKIAGFSWLNADVMQDTITSLAVFPKFQRQGVGSKLIAELEKQARKLQIKKLVFHTGIDNEKARNFFNKMGYKEIEVKLEKVFSHTASEELNNKYLQGGGVTQITPRVKRIANQIPGESKEFIKNTFRWFEENGFYKSVSEKDRRRLLDTEHLQRTADQILESGYTIACGEQAIIFIVLCRAKGVPVKYVEAVGLDWLQQENDENMHEHAFVEVYLDGEWNLVDPARRKIYDNLSYRELGFVKWAEGIDFRGLRNSEDKHYSWKNLAVLKKETVAFKRQWEKRK